MSATDWSIRYLGLGIFSTSGTVLTWMLDSAFVLVAALVTTVAFASLALFHAYRLRTRSPPYPQKIDRVP